MRTVRIHNIKSFVVISDVHLREPEDKMCQTFITVLEKIKRQHLTNKIDALILLGDIFDFITVSKKFFLTLWQPVFIKLKELKDLGIITVFIEGNHDFGFEHFHSPSLDAIFSHYGDFILEIIHPELGHTIFRHGDNLICSPSYLKPRAFFKSFLFQKCANLFIPGFLMHYICNRYAKKSRKRGEAYNALTAPFLRNCLDAYFKTYSSDKSIKIDTLFLGHIHVYLSILFNNVMLQVGPDWFSHPNYYIFYSKQNSGRVFINNMQPQEFDILALK